LPDSTEIIENNEREFSYLNFVTNEFQKPIKGADVAIQSNVDPILKIVIKYTKDGWPKNVQFKEELESFYSRRHQLTLEQDILTWGHRVVIPQKFRNVLMNELHSTHQGIVRIKSLARSFFWWPRIDKDLENLVKSCEICRRNQNDPPRIPYSNWPEAKVPFERIHLDFCGPIQNLCYLILIDAYSKWLEVIPMKETVTEKLIETLKNIFVRFGFPRVIVSDNGPQFVSGKFVTFCEANGIKHMTSPPYHPPSNGQAENSVRTFKMAFEKMLVDPQNSNDSINEIVNKLLYLNRNTPHTVTDKTPYQLMFNRKGWLRWELLAPKKQKMKSGNNVKNFAQNESVYAKDFRTNKWVKAKIKNFIGKYCYIVLTENNLTWKRHANHIIKASQSEHKTLINDNSSSAKESGNSFSNILEEKAKMIPTVSTSYCTSDMETSNTGKNPNNSNSTNTVDLGDVTSNVRPKRNIKCPDRLNL
jgi:transposase InsO family protein